MEWTPKASIEESSFEVVDKVTVRRKDDYRNILTILANNPISTLDYDYFEVKFKDSKRQKSKKTTIPAQ